MLRRGARPDDSWPRVRAMHAIDGERPGSKGRRGRDFEAFRAEGVEFFRGQR